MRLQSALPICLVAALGLSAACSPTPTPLRIASVSPSQLSAPKPALLLVTGDGFQQGDTISLSQSGALGLNLRALEGSLWVNDQLLSAHLPGGLALGRYDVVVTEPDGRQATLQNALQVGKVEATSTPATASPTAAVTQGPQTKATLPPHTASPEPAETPTATPALSPTETPPPQPTTLVPPTRPPTVTATGAAGGQLNVSGHWQLVDTIQPGGEQVRFADLVLQQQGNRVSGSSPDGLNSLQGVLTGDTLQATYRASNGETGSFTWIFSSDGTSFSGSFIATGVNRGTSQGVRIAGATDPQPVQVEVLTSRHGHNPPSHGHAAHGGD